MEPLPHLIKRLVQEHTLAPPGVFDTTLTAPIGESDSTREARDRKNV